MRMPRFKLQTLILAVVTFAAWFGLFHAYPILPLFFLLFGPLLFALVLIQIWLDDRQDRESRSVKTLYLWVGASGSLACASHFAIAGLRSLS
jgi:4-hydroxybenzoate polyprenyltransferase